MAYLDVLCRTPQHVEAMIALTFTLVTDSYDTKNDVRCRAWAHDAVYGLILFTRPSPNINVQLPAPFTAKDTANLVQRWLENLLSDSTQVVCRITGNPLPDYYPHLICAVTPNVAQYKTAFNQNISVPNIATV